MSELFQRYVGIDPKDAPVAAAVVEQKSIRQLSAITGGTAVWKKVRGGSMVLSEILLHDRNAKSGDYIIALEQDTFVVMAKDEFEKLYKLEGLIQPSTERR